LSVPAAALVASSLAGQRLSRNLQVCDRHSSLDDIATIIFSSGSNRRPQGRPSSRTTTSLRTWSKSSTRFSCCTPMIASWAFFHFFTRFGFYGGTPFCLPGRHRHRAVVFHPNPLDSRVIGALVIQVCGNHAARDANLLECLHAALHAGRIRQVLRVCHGPVRRKIAGSQFHKPFEDHFWYPAARRLYGLHGMLASRLRLNTIDFRRCFVPPSGGRRRRGQHRPSLAGNHGENRGSRYFATLWEWTRPGTAGLCAGPEHHARLPQQPEKNR